MISVNEAIVFLWILPVALQILLPLLILGVWLLLQVPLFFSRKMISQDLGITQTTPT